MKVKDFFEMLSDVYFDGLPPHKVLLQLNWQSRVYYEKADKDIHVEVNSSRIWRFFIGYLCSYLNCSVENLGFSNNEIYGVDRKLNKSKSVNAFLSIRSSKSLLDGSKYIKDNFTKFEEVLDKSLDKYKVVSYEHQTFTSEENQHFPAGLFDKLNSDFFHKLEQILFEKSNFEYLRIHQQPLGFLRHPNNFVKKHFKQVAPYSILVNILFMHTSTFEHVLRCFNLSKSFNLYFSTTTFRPYSYFIFEFGEKSNILAEIFTEYSSIDKNQNQLKDRMFINSIAKNELNSQSGTLLTSYLNEIRDFQELKNGLNIDKNVLANYTKELKRIIDLELKSLSKNKKNLKCDSEFELEKFLTNKRFKVNQKLSLLSSIK